ncbi:MAG: methyltransferase domain-containing protein [Phenylobacterium sp.]|nr:MAG: methyltransferase domain-containing protein [Phenylobacterium sp.]
MPTFLHVGCGSQRKASITKGFDRPEWTELRLDIDPAAKPDIVADMTDMSAVPTGSMDGLFSSHNLEHLHAHQVPLALAEFVRVLKPEGFAVVTCPDLQLAASLVAAGKLDEAIYVSPDGPITPLDVIFGHRRSLAAGQVHMAHRTGFSLQSLFDALAAAGFARIAALRRRAGVELWAVAARQPLDDAALQALSEDHLPQAPAAAG